jgi:hypothetical protein
MKQIVIACAKEDFAYRNDLTTALFPLEKRGLVRLWHDGKIGPGELWQQVICRQLEQADIIVPLISADFFTSDYSLNAEIADTFARQQSKGGLIVPVIIRACAWEANEWLAPLRVLPSNQLPVSSWSNKDEAYQNIVQQITTFLLPPGPAEQPPPAASTPPVARPPERPAKTSFFQKILPYKTHLEIASAVVAVLTFVFTYFPMKPSEVAAQKALLEAKSKGTIPVMRDFLNKYPDGKTADEAKVVLKTLEHRFDSCLQSANALRAGGENDAARATAAAANRIYPDAPELKIFFEK